MNHRGIIAVPRAVPGLEGGGATPTCARSHALSRQRLPLAGRVLSRPLPGVCCRTYKGFNTFCADPLAALRANWCRGLPYVATSRSMYRNWCLPTGALCACIYTQTFP